METLIWKLDKDLKQKAIKITINSIIKFMELDQEP